MLLTAVRFIGPPDRSHTASKPMIFTCNDRENYVIKFHGLPGQAQMLINEFVAYQLATKLNIPTLEADVINIPPQLIENERELVQLNVKGGLHFGTKFKKSLVHMPLTGAMSFVSNKNDIPSIIGFDHWINNGDRRGNEGNIIIEKSDNGDYHLIILDHGHAFNGPQWTPEQLSALADNVIPLEVKGTAVYGVLAIHVNGKDPFKDIIDQITNMDKDMIINITNQTPDEWGLTAPHKDALINFLEKRKNKVGNAIYLLKDQFPNWKEEQVQWNF